MEESMHH